MPEESAKQTLSLELERAKQTVETVENSSGDNSDHAVDRALNRARAMNTAHRAQVEKSLKRKLDTRCSLFVLIYVSA